MNYSTSCRCCLKEISQEDIECSSPWTMDKYIFCIQLQTYEDRDFPKNFCRNCSGKIQSTYIFIKEAQACNQKLQNQISQNKGIKLEFNPNNGNVFYNSSLKDLLENSAYKPKEESTSNEIVNKNDTLKNVERRRPNSTKKAIHKKKQKTDVKLAKDVKKYVMKKPKSNSSESSDEVDIQNMNDDSLEEVEFPYVPVSKTQSENWFLELDPITNTHSDIEKKSERSIAKKKDKLSNIKTDEDFEDNITKSEISKCTETAPSILNRRHRSNNLAQFTCSVCNKLFKQYPPFEKHMRIHHPEHETSKTSETVAEQFRAKPHACDKCEKRFRFRVLLNRHFESAHSDEKPFPCGSCDKSFKRKENLVRHTMTHTSKETREKPFECEQCGKRFAERRGLAKHVYFHTGARPYTCDCCQKSFQTKQILNQHMGVHEARLPFMCDICGKGFRDKYKLLEHMPKHTGERLFPCKSCSYRAAYRSVLRRHEKIVHKTTHANKHASSSVVQ